MPAHKPRMHARCYSGHGVRNGGLAAAESKCTLVKGTDRHEPFKGRLLEDDLVFWQCFSVKSYEVGSDLRITVEALMNYMQETAINHFKGMGLNAGGFGCTPEMCRRNLIWAIRKTHISFHSYPSWTEVIDVKTRMYTSRRGMHREWLLCSSRTGDLVAKSASHFVVMNMNTRKLSTFAEEILHEMKPHSRDSGSFDCINKRKLQKLDIDKADYVRTSLTPMWNDVDANSHVSNVKYINWIIEGVPRSILGTYVLDNVCLEYRRECDIDSNLCSISTTTDECVVDQGSRNEGIVKFDHSLLLQNGMEIARARTEWRPRVDS
ncbi:hypothetical protein MLD38_007956 [Melastoma candidum]|uniref:Uncharacterized protein n=1 Tax=Melastoma candidum TaxID=119954 RepID=A0ACB9RSR1_9MYRT|nr:hypothetical protein MLD38_007956 [Melastoma candidum]